MARETREAVPGTTSSLRRVSLSAPHWHRARRMLAAEAAVVTTVSGAGLMHVAVTPGSEFRVAGLLLTPALCAVLLAVAAGAVMAMIHRGAAKLFCAGASVVGLALMTGCAVGAAHHDPGPLAFSSWAILMWVTLFCYNLGLGVWLMLPDQSQGPGGLPSRPGKQGQPKHADTATETDAS